MAITCGDFELQTGVGAGVKWSEIKHRIAFQVGCLAHSNEEAGFGHQVMLPSTYMWALV